MSVLTSHHLKGAAPEEVPPEVTVHIKEAPKMTDRIAEHDIVQKNGLGQNVVVVHAGQPIPEGIEAEPKETGTKKQREKKSAD